MGIFSSNLNPFLTVVIIAISIIQFFIKGVALWRASRLKQRNWFVGLFIIIPINDFGIIELLYLFYFAEKRLTLKEIKTWSIRN